MKTPIEPTEMIELRVYECGGDYLYDIYRTKDPYDALAWLCDTVSNYRGVKVYARIEKRITPKSFYANTSETGGNNEN